MIFNQLFMWTA